MLEGWKDALAQPTINLILDMERPVDMHAAAVDFVADMTSGPGDD